MHKPPPPLRRRVVIFTAFLLANCGIAFAYDAAVVSGSPESTQIGLSVLENGGNAADSAVAVSLALGVAEPYGSGIGGKIAILYYDASTREVSFIDGMVESPSKFPVKEFITLPSKEQKRSFRSVCIPGLVAGLGKMHKDHGSQSWQSLVAPSAKLAREGFMMTEHDEAIFKIAQSGLKQNPETRRLYLIDDKVPSIGERLPNPDLANTLDTLAQEGPESFYSGSIAKTIAEGFSKNAGWITLNDLRQYEAIERPPLSMDWQDYNVFSSPSPTTGGATVLLTLKALEAMPTSGDYSTIERFNMLGNALACAYTDYQQFGDSPEWRKRQAAVFSKRNYSELQDLMRERIKESIPMSQGDTPGSDDESSTTHFIVVDKTGNIACITQSLGHRFGAFVIAPGTGFLLNNGMNNFAKTSTSSINYIAESKRPRSTIAPTIVLKKGKPVLAIGSPAGQRIPTGIAQIISETLLYEQDLQEAINAPRFHLRRPLKRSEASNYVEIEAEADVDLVHGLRQHGWDVHLRSSESYYFGGVNAVIFTPSGELVAAADPRRSNSAGYAK
ncbi:gamma-glutamyltransferase [Cerasicoccus arenae]|uniref:Glutathione hydrolase proenzyme n=1 Tax=Cerasicoccus arenae TaxID=424488 RepID=A0A8J3DEB0_9BACT|nr:gamma-glutamyltransferase [Cerasicoccus arenae]MBK1858295.1 gamma-glutamyltransferase [Cerasicoccus arenae]GHB90591.1 gamma-glutamyltransferase [Cerasicoccus arenae]